ncbi:2466_t:CDS:2 [Ambispora gerdemannii]|uniref:2466_t:CDS:1 n=1 Tax=Ambispora gerdemannii TaxID=144530 RepID=A0A9N9FFK7_9GLOM|nr:2466_t:CDS:2 [Ambispora gerdemannii]
MGFWRVNSVYFVIRMWMDVADEHLQVQMNQFVCRGSLAHALILYLVNNACEDSHESSLTNFAEYSFSVSDGNMPTMLLLLTPESKKTCMFTQMKNTTTNGGDSQKLDETSENYEYFFLPERALS